MDDQKRDDILKNIDTPAIDANAKKRALNLAMAEFDSAQKEKTAKYYGTEITQKIHLWWHGHCRSRYNRRWHWPTACA
jgi:hypothetical protein